MWLAALALLQTTMRPATAHRSGAFASDRVRESSGVAVSRSHPGILWTHNDSGDGPFIYATDTTGADLGALRVPGAMAIDWEDMALGPCPTTPGDCLYLADTGDNLERRPTVTLYAVPEPGPPRGPADTTRLTGAATVLHFRYPNGPTDVEAIFVAPPPDGGVYLVSKGRNGMIRLYVLPQQSWRSDTLATAADVQSMAIDARAGARVTGAAVSRSGTMVAVRTYGSIYRFARSGDGRLQPAGACDIRGLEEIGESIAFVSDSTFVLTSESNRRTGTIDIVRCP
jgi:hypothetical protein